MVNLSRLRRRRRDIQFSQLPDKPSRERHFFSILGSTLSVIMLILALSLKEWAKAQDSTCSFLFSLTYVDVHVAEDNAFNKYNMTTYYKTNQQILISCVLSVTVLTLMSSVVATIVSCGIPREKMEFLRHYSVFNIVSLLCTVLVAGLWLAVVQTLPRGHQVLPSSCNLKISVSFGYCFYLLLVGGLFSLGAASFNLLCGRSAADRRRMLRQRYREQQNREAARNSHTTAGRDLTDLSAVPPAYSTLENTLTTDTSGNTTETSLNELEPEQTDQDDPTSPPPPYTP